MGFREPFFFLGLSWPGTVILPISASQVARIIEVSLGWMVFKGCIGWAEAGP
jgi:hypothetical protein